MKKIKILILDNSVTMTGALRSIDSITQLLSEEFEFYYGVPTNSKLINNLRSNSKVIRFYFLEIQKNFRLIFYLPVLLFNVIRITVIIRKREIRILHVNDMYNMCGIAVKLLCPRIKLVYHVRLLPDSYIKSLYKFFIKTISRYADTIIAVSEAVKLDVRKLGAKVEVVYDGLPLKEKYGRFAKSPEQIRLLYLSNFTQGKGHAYAIRAFAEAKKSVPKIKMFMAGGNLGLGKNLQLRHNLEQLVNDLGLKNEIQFGDFLHDIEREMKTSDIFLNFSESESFSMTCLEALLYGVPLIATDCGGPSELFEHEKSGLLVPNRDVKAMTDAIIKLSNSSELRESLAKEGKGYASEKFNIAKSAEALRKIYVQIER